MTRAHPVLALNHSLFVVELVGGVSDTRSLVYKEVSCSHTLSSTVCRSPYAESSLLEDLFTLLGVPSVSYPRIDSNWLEPVWP